MDRYLAAAILGVVEGLTEFLPVSSTAHIRFAQKLMAIPAEDAYWKMFAIVIQLGAILSVIVYFRKRLTSFVYDFWKRCSSSSDTYPSKPLWRHPLVLVLIAFVVTAVPCYLIDDQIGEQLESIQVMGFALIIGGFAMWLIDWFFSPKASTQIMDDISLKQSLFIGFSQILAAAFPGRAEVWQRSQAAKWSVFLVRRLWNLASFFPFQ